MDITSTAYVLSLSGGYEEPSFQSFADLAKADEVFESWKEDADTEQGDRVDLLQLDTFANGTNLIKRIRYHS